MYEESKFKLDINWKSILIKLSILLLVVFVICFLIFRPKKSNDGVSLNNNITNVKDAAIKYYKNNMSVKKIGDYKKVSVEELIKENYLENQEDSKGNSCTNDDSFAYLTKVRDDEFVLKISMKCGKNKEAQVYNLNNKDLSVIVNTEDDKNEVIKEDDAIVDKDDDANNQVIEDDKEIANDSNKQDENKKEDSIIATKPTDKVLRYKHIKYGEWTEGTKYASNIENSTKKIDFYKFCFKNYCVIDRIDNKNKYVGYTATYQRTEIVPIYRYTFVIWSNSCCIKGFINTGITEYR